MLNRSLTLQYIREMMTLLKVYSLRVPDLNLPWPEESVQNLRIHSDSSCGDFTFYFAGFAKYDGYDLPKIANAKNIKTRRIIHNIAPPNWMLVRVYDSLKKSLRLYLRHQNSRSKLPHFQFLYRRLHQLIFLDAPAPITSDSMFPIT